MGKRFFSILLVFSMLAGMFVIMPVQANADPAVWDGSVAASFAGGNGTQVTPYQISNGAQLAYFASLVNGGDTCSGKYFVLTADITLNADSSNYKNWGVSAPANNWVSIGEFYSDNGHVFLGTFDGQGHTIRGMYSNGASGTDFVTGGLFGYIGGTVKNFALVESYAKGRSSEPTGALSSYMGGGTSAYVDSVFVEAFIEANEKDGNGILIGQLAGTRSNDLLRKVSNCVAVGQVNASAKSYNAGIVANGNNHCLTIENCLNLATVSGYRYNAGITNNAGYTSSTAYNVTVNNCINIGQITSSDTSKNQYKACAIAYFGTTSRSSLNSTGCYYLTGTGSYGVYENGEGSLSKGSASEVESSVKDFVDSALSLPGWTNRDSDVMVPTGVKDFAQHSTYYNAFAPAWLENYETETEFEISTVKQFVELTKFVNRTYVTFGNFYGKTVKLTANLNLNPGLVASASGMSGEAVDYESIGNGPNWDSGIYFAGTFDGQGHTISGLYMTEQGNGGGLFGSVAGSADIKNFSLTNSCINIDNESGAVGGIAGLVERGANFSKIYVDSTVFVYGGGDSVGAIVGQMTSDKTEYCDELTTIENCVSAATVDAGGKYIGGILGNGNGKTVTLSNCLMIGSVSGTSYVGGIFGYNTGTMTVANCIYVGTGYGDYPIGDSNKGVNLTITNCYSVAQTNNQYRMGVDDGSGTIVATKFKDNVNIVEIGNLIGPDAVAITGWTKRAGDIVVPTAIKDFDSMSTLFTQQLFDGASVRLDTPTGLRFKAILGGNYLNSIKNANEGKTVTYGIIITPTDYIVEADNKFTVAALDALSHTNNYIIVPAQNLTGGGADDGYYEYSAVISHLNSYNYQRAFSARAYVAVDDGAGSVTYYYSAYDSAKNSRSIATVAEAAYNDTSKTQSDTYRYEFAQNAGIYSPYTEAQKDLLLAFYGKVASNVNFMTYNIRNVEGGDSLMNDPLTFEYNGRQNEVVNYILSASPDVIGIQEASIKTHAYLSQTLSWFDYLDNNTTGLTANGYASFRGEDILKTGKKQMYNPIYYKTAKYNLIDSGFHDLTLGDDEKKACTYVVLEDKTTGLTFVYVNVHLARAHTTYQEDMAGLLKSFLTELQGTYTCPIIIGGDFNGSYSDYNGYDTYWGSTAVSLRSAATNKTNGNSEVNTTFDGLTNRSGPIDLYFALNTANSVDFHNYAVTDNKLTQGTNSGKYPSDHLPVRVVATFYGDLAD